MSMSDRSSDEHRSHLKKHKKHKRHKRSRSPVSHHHTHDSTDSLTRQQRNATLAAYDIQAKLLDDQNTININSNDHTSTQPFVWRKKVERDILSNQFDASAYTVDSYKQRLIEKQYEIEQVRKQRENRIAEMNDMKLLKEQMIRDSINEQNNQWINDEKHFNVKQYITKSLIRINDQRYNIMDLLIKNLQSFDTIRDEHNHNQNNTPIAQINIDIDLLSPIDAINTGNHNELHDLIDEISVYIDSVDNGLEQLYWNSCVVLINDRLIALDAAAQHELHGTAPPSPVSNDIKQLFVDKSYDQLLNIEKNIENKLSEDDGSVDVTYWTIVLHHMQLYKATAFVTQYHIDSINRRHGHTIAQQLINKIQQKYQQSVNGNPSGSSPATTVDNTVATSTSHELQLLASTADNTQNTLTERFSTAAEEQLYKQSTANSSIGGDENKFSVEYKLKPINKLSPFELRKPRYFNKVRTGYDWNKYNQTHYSKDSPPPKIVQGYKFMLFYPDLIDKTVAPSYTLIDDPDSTSGEFQIIRFIGGAPYEDVAFKIVKKEWEFNHKRGYKCVFDRGVLQLNFNFKRYFYKR